jgi:catechol 2,3-dioxygenase
MNAPAPALLPDDITIDRVNLRVADLAQSLPFYTKLIGLAAGAGDGETARLSPAADRPPIIQLTQQPRTVARPEYAFGLYHYAVLYPDRPSLARVLQRLFDAQWPFDGFSDHGVSEAAYLSDPDGNGMELYIDRPREQWPRQGDRIAMFSRPLDVERLLSAASSGAAHPPRIGHIHLHVTDLDRARRFYHDALGFGITQGDYPGALFLAAGGYHHHVGLNTWARRPAGENAAGLLDWILRVPDENARAALRGRLQQGGYVLHDSAAGLRATDADGNAVVITG